MQKNISLTELAAMVQRGFDNTATKADLGNLATKADLRLVVDQLDLMAADIRDIKVGFAGLTRLVSDLEASVQKLDKRVTRLEEKTARAR